MRKKEALFSIHRLTRTGKPQILEHLMRLDPSDRRRRFGLPRDGSDLARYVAAIDDVRDVILGAVTASGELLGVAHLAIEGDVAELGLTVDRRARRRGVGLALAQRSLLEAQRAGAREFRFDCAADNDGMRAIADRLQMEFDRDGVDAVARRAVTPVVPEALAA